MPWRLASNLEIPWMQECSRGCCELIETALLVNISHGFWELCFLTNKHIQSNQLTELDKKFYLMVTKEKLKKEKEWMKRGKHNLRTLKRGRSWSWQQIHNNSKNNILIGVKDVNKRWVSFIKKTLLVGVDKPKRSFSQCIKLMSTLIHSIRVKIFVKTVSQSKSGQRCQIKNSCLLQIAKM
jgi:hypothetical protein